MEPMVQMKYGKIADSDIILCVTEIILQASVNMMMVNQC